MYQGLGVSKEIYPCLLFAIQQNALISRKNLQKAYNSGLFVFVLKPCFLALLSKFTS